MHRSWLIARRAVQLFVLAAFLLGPWAGLWVARGTLASSEWFGVIRLTDPFIAVQSLLAGHSLARDALVGAAAVTVIFILTGGRSFCAWVCPVNPVTDLAAWLRVRLGLPSLLGRYRPDRRLRYAVLGVALAVSALLGSIAWETINPITLLHRALLFGLVGGYAVTLAVFLFDLLILPRGWCGYVCPVGAFYGLVGRLGVLRVSAVRRHDCTQCGDCFRVCPEPQVIAPALYGAAHGNGPAISSADCIRCARCLDVCDGVLCDPPLLIVEVEDRRIICAVLQIERERRAWKRWKVERTSEERCDRVRRKQSPRREEAHL